MTDDHGLSDDEWSALSSVASARTPSFLSSTYHGAWKKPYPSAVLPWFLGFAALLLFLPGFVALPLAIRAARRGNKLAWAAAAWAIVATVASWFVISR